MKIEQILNSLYEKLQTIKSGIEKKRLTYALEEMIYTLEDAGGKVDFNTVTNRFVILN